MLTNFRDFSVFFRPFQNSLQLVTYFFLKCCILDRTMSKLDPRLRPGGVRYTEFEFVCRCQKSRFFLRLLSKPSSVLPTFHSLFWNPFYFSTSSFYFKHIINVHETIQGLLHIRSVGDSLCNLVPSIFTFYYFIHKPDNRWCCVRLKLQTQFGLIDRRFRFWLSSLLLI